MSAVTIQISETQLDLWTNIRAWNPRENFKNNQKYSQLPAETLSLFYNFSDEEIAKLQNVTHVSVPFAYWKAGNPECPSRASPFYRMRWGEGKNPNILGRIVFPIERAPDNYYSSAYAAPHNYHSEVLKNIGYTIDCAEEKISKLKGYRKRVFSTFIPVSCRGFANSLISLFPWTQITYRYDRTTPLRFVADLITLPFRLLTFLPRLFYQCVCSKSTPPFSAKVIDGATLDWNSGAFSLYKAGYGAGRKAFIGSPVADPRDFTNCLGSGENKTIYFG